MKYLELLMCALLAVLIAVAIERLVAHFCRRADDDSARLDAAMEAMRDQREALDNLLARETVPDLVKEWVIVFADAALTKRGAHVMLRTVFGKDAEPMSEPAEHIVEEFVAATSRMRHRDPEAYEVYRTFIYRIPIMSLLQWPETYKAMGQLSLRLAEEREPAAARDAVLMTQGSAMVVAAA